MRDRKGYTFWFLITLAVGAIAIACVYIITQCSKNCTSENMDFLSLWAAVITLVFLMFSVIGLLNVDNKINELSSLKKELDDQILNLSTTCKELTVSAKEERSKLIEQAELSIKKIIDASTRRQNIFDSISRALVEPAPDRQVQMFTNILRDYPNTEGINYSYLFTCRGMAYLKMSLNETLMT